MKSCLSKAALAVVCLTSSIDVYTNSDETYLEDSNIYTDVADNLKNGWNWGVSSASAEIIVIWGYPGGFDPGGGGGAGSAGSGQDTSGEVGDLDEPPEAEKLREKLQCELKVDNLVRNCKSLYGTFSLASGGFCAYVTARIPLVNKRGPQFCAATATAAAAQAVLWCESQGQAKKIRDCQN